MFQALCVGNCIAQQLAADQNLKLIGKTSRGCFLQTESTWTVFLSEETPRGPLTINLPPNTIIPIKGAASGIIPLCQGILHFSDTVHLSLQNGPRWQPSPPLKPILPADTRRNTFIETIQTILQRKAASDLTGILPDLLPLLDIPSPASVSDGPFTKKLHALISCLQSADDGALEDHLTAFLGQGSGLTPSGDDFLLGFFLTLNRWGAFLPLANTARPLGQAIAAAARKKTTHLSASLITCATMGEADQRLVLALDSLMTLETCSPVWLDGLLSWGSSSGMDAFVGMLLASGLLNLFGLSEFCP
jgi:Protein of unknown function (DUF2877)